MQKRMVFSKPSLVGPAQRTPLLLTGIHRKKINKNDDALQFNLRPTSNVSEENAANGDARESTVGGYQGC
jgi:hypothetical protein